MVAGFAAILAVVGSYTLIQASPASAAGGHISLVKTVDGDHDRTGVLRSQSFTYHFEVGCDEGECTDAALDDVIPTQFAGFTIAALQTASGHVVNAALSGGTGGTECVVGGTVTASTASPCTLHAAFGDTLTTGTGIDDGDTVGVDLILTVPADLSPSWAYNNVAVPNTATATSEGSTPASDTARVTVTIPITVDVQASKAWSPNTQQYDPDEQTSFTIGARNLSNVPATSLVLEDPQGAVDGASSLDASNPFNKVDFVGLCDGGTLPQGADTVQVDLYVQSGGSGPWNWRTGVPATDATASIPALAAGDVVGGIRLSYAGTAITESGTASAQCVNVSQRDTDRATGDSLVLGTTVENTVGATVTVPGQTPVTKTASDTFTVGGLTVVVTAGKTITPATIPAGASFSVSLQAKNDSNGPLSSLTITEPGSGQSFLSQQLAFDSIDPAAWSWPSGADSASFVWTYSGGGESAPVILDPSSGPPATPTAPAGEWITGFHVTYTGSIDAGTTAGIDFTVDSDPTMVDVSSTFDHYTNTMDVAGTNPAGSDTDSAQAGVDIYYPVVDVTLDKSVSPTLATPGGTVLSKLAATTATNSARVNPTTIVVEDAWDGTGTFWDAFRARQISFTQVPADSTLDVQYATGTPGSLTWTDLPDGTGIGTGTFSYDLVGKLGALADDVVGLRFTFTAVSPGVFPQGTIVQPNIVFAASATLRSGGPTTTAPNTPVAYTNTAQATGEGVSGGMTVASQPVTDDGSAQIVTYDGGPGTLIAGKAWADDVVSSQSGALERTNLSWGVTVPGYSTVVLSDPPAGQETSPADTVFQAFDLTAIRPVSYTQDPLMRWDAVTSVELWYSGAWHTVTAPGGSWMNGTGFKGYTLDPVTEAPVTTGVRISVASDDAARTASSEPGRPDPGTGVAWGASNRPLALDWTLRNAQRVPSGSGWVTEDDTFNGGQGVVRNDFQVDADGTTRGASDTIVLTDTPPGVATAKTASPATITVPYPGDVPPSGYPTVTFTADAWNTAQARASYLRVTDPTPCPNVNDCTQPANTADPGPDVFTGQSYDPATNPFERFAITGVSFTVPSGIPIDPDASEAALWHYDQASGTTSVTTTTMAALAAAPASAFADVIGVSVVYQSSDPATTGGLIPMGTTSANHIRMTLDTQLRTTKRSDGAEISADVYAVAAGIDQTNEVLAQSFDPVLADASMRPLSRTPASTHLTGASLDVVASKAISPATILQTNRTAPITVTLGANDGTSTAAAELVTISDTDTDFWDSFAFTALGAVTLPAGADRVRVDVQLNDDPAWVDGTAGPTAALPSTVNPADYPQITGIRFVFTNAANQPFSTTAPSADWSAQAVFSAVLRDSVEFPATIPGTQTITDTVNASATHQGLPQADASADAPVTLSSGTPRLDVRKDPQVSPKIVEPGDTTPWKIRFENVGTSYLGLNTLQDDLGTALRYDGEAPAYASGGSVSTAGVTVSQPDAEHLTFTFPPGTRMAPGDWIEITVGIILVPGQSGGTNVPNSFYVDTDATFAPGDCVNSSGNGQGVLSGLASNQCGSSNFVTVKSGALLFAEKEVRGDVVDTMVSGASNVNNPALPCTAEAGGFYRTACAPYTRIGGTDEWRIGGANTGTVAFTSMSMVDVLPQPGDLQLVSGSPRESEWRPVLDTTFGLQQATGLGGAFPADGVPSGTVTTLMVSTAPTPCFGAGGAPLWGTDPLCTDANWTPMLGFADDPAQITAIRVDMDFTGTSAGALMPGGSVHFLYRTINEPRVGTAPTDEAVVPALQGATNPRAWDQVGVTAVRQDNGQRISRAPSRSGVQLVSGSLAVTKTVSGSAEGTAVAPSAFDFDLSCVVPDGTGGTTAVDLASSASLSVPANGTARLDGVPLGAQCQIAEHGALGSFGESGRTPSSPQSVTISQQGTAADAVPAAQATSFDNSYTAADIVLTKQASATPLVAGGAAAPAWTITVSNNGPDTAVGPFTVDDLWGASGTLPGEFTVTGFSGAGWSCTPTATVGFQCQRSDPSETLASGAAFPPIEVTAQAGPSFDPASSPVPNAASVTSGTHDPDPSNNEDGDAVPVTVSADLTLDKALASASPGAGGPISWTITVRNEGAAASLSSAAHPITVTDVVPAGVDGLTVAEPLPTGWSLATPGPFAAGDTVTLTLADGASMAPGDGVQFTLTGTIDHALADGTHIVNNAEVTPGETPDPDPDNNHDSTDTTPDTSTTLGIAKTRVVLDGGSWVPAASLSPVPPVVAGQPVSYEITVANNGLADARDVDVTDALPSYLRFDSFEPVSGSWTRTSSASGFGDPQSFLLQGVLAPGATATLRVTLVVDPAHEGTVENVASVAGSNTTGTPEDADDSGSTRVADLSVAKTHSGEAVAGGSLAYTVTVTNEGPSDSSEPILVTDTLPDGFAYAAGTATVSIAGGPVEALEPTVSGQTLSWTIGSGSSALDSGATIVIGYTADIAADTPALSGYMNTVTIDGPDDPNPDNDTASDPVAVTTQAQLTVTKTASAASGYAPGATVDYRITVTNDGPSAARSVTLADLAPAGLVLTAISGTGWDCSLPQASCSVDVLAPGTTVIAVTARIADTVSAPATLTNVAVLSWDDGQPVRPTARSSADIAVDQKPASLSLTGGSDLALPLGGAVLLLLGGAAILLIRRLRPRR